MWSPEAHNIFFMFKGKKANLMVKKQHGDEPEDTFEYHLYTDRPAHFRHNKKKIIKALTKDDPYFAILQLTIEKTIFLNKRKHFNKLQNFLYDWAKSNFENLDICYRAYKEDGLNILEFYTDRPGYLIGPRGKVISDLKEKLSKTNFNIDKVLINEITFNVKQYIDIAKYMQAWDDYEYGHGF